MEKQMKMRKSKEQSETINELIVSTNADTDFISDGKHCFGELYEDRLELFITLCRIARDKFKVWRSKTYNNDTSLIQGVIEDKFILGINIEPDKQITYYIPLCKWDICNFAITLTECPSYDGHTSINVLDRLPLLDI